ncbi:MAG: type II/IV secretion system protein [Planctomycetia bacterium]|nr:type II/IV secretion system protein [Planctomycetia bacterium]
MHQPVQRVLDLTRVVASRQALQIVSGQLARRLGILPVMISDDELHIVMANDEDDVALSQFEAQVSLPVRVEKAANPEKIPSLLRRYYPDRNQNDGSPLALLEEIINRALLYRSSDIHLDPESTGGVVRLRIDGLMQQERAMSLDALNELVSAIKVSSGLDIAEKRVPQDGQLSMTIDGEEISMRVATVPTLYGEKTTLRILATESVAAELASLDSLGMSDLHHEIFQTTLGYSHGVILLSGPTGSGKTTTLYAALRHLKTPGTLHILSIEDPVEIPLDGINQIRVDSERVSFARALRSTLRHDPDVIMIGEIRDGETADIAVKSALTGHLVLSTLHANDSIGVVSRLLNLGIAPELVNSALRLVVAQRLVRKPCPHCVQWKPADSSEKLLFGWNPSDDFQIPIASGCPLCHSTGYVGRLGLYEMIPVDNTLRAMIRAGESEENMAKYAFENAALPTLRNDGADKILQGKTTIAEVQRVAFEMNI